ncbi:hypothetical protein [Cellulomonas marina]|uniref:SurA N-terminal domain-containing protein n=1 Tax=Cellulomonas marina TaxID=988821 RepID=A0A1I0X4W1_9CELL|nr:hypothetical protein [Cellulomonas marina]GIG28912.1 hypothetical protein Cma02nite_15120 [Cellulomonas marina]SFA95378.1 hypothetical protein SAMN05421867_10488 [Cellulomonas marina]
MRTRTGRTAATALAGLVLAAGLTACAGAPGAAAVVDGREIPTSDLQDVITEIGPLLGSATTAQVLAVLVQEPVVTQLAAENGVGVSDDQARSALEAALASAGVTVDELSPASLSVGRYLAAATALQGLPDGGAEAQEELLARVAEQDLEVNPRFGAVDERGTVTAPTALPWLVAPEAAAPAAG